MAAVESDGWGPFLVRVGNNIDRDVAMILSRYFNFSAAEVGRLREARIPGHEIVSMMESKEILKRTDISRLVDALTSRDVGQARTAQNINRFYDEYKRNSRLVQIQGKIEENRGGGRIAAYSLGRFLDLQPSRTRELRNIVVVGKTGAGKSTTVNTILGRQGAKVGWGPRSVTKWSSYATCKYYANTIVVADTPGLADNTQDEKTVMEQLARLAFLMRDGVHCYIICMSATDNRFTKSTEQMLEKIKTLGGEEVYRWCMALYTKAESELNPEDPLDSFLDAQKEHEVLKKFFDGIKDRVVAVNNKTRDQNEKEQNRKSIIAMVDKVISDNLDNNRDIVCRNNLSEKANKIYENVVSAIPNPKGRLYPVLLNATIEAVIMGSTSDKTSSNSFTKHVLKCLLQSETCTESPEMLEFSFDGNTFEISRDECETQIRDIFETIKHQLSYFHQFLIKMRRWLCLD